MNNAALTNDSGTTNDDATDYFGMSLQYNTVDADLANAQLYNGNISGMKWSNYGDGRVKQKGYTYGYDAMNRIQSSTYREKTTSWTANNKYNEAGFTYDLNGNIQTLTRTGKSGTSEGVQIDNLDFDYGSGATASNKLLYVQDLATDATHKTKGFFDGNAGTAQDYKYDQNGNMTHDLNKGIGTNLTDATNKITYNFLNLPETVTKGGNSIRYIYDATGRKLSQVTNYGTVQNQTDYVGEFIYENNTLQFINHEEGRIVVSTEKLITEHTCEVTTGLTVTAAGAATLATHTSNGEKYVRITASSTASGTGAFVNGAFPVSAGQRYRIRAKGYAGTNTAFIRVRTNGSTNLNFPGSALGTTVNTESWVEQIVTIPSGATSMETGVAWNTPASGNIIYLNEFTIELLGTQTPEYQYHLKDHLGNVRLTFTTKDETNTYTATFEDNTQTTEQNTFKNHSRVSNDLFDHTDAGTTYTKSQMLNGAAGYQVGITKTLAVMPGDVVSAQVYAKYLGTSGGSGNLSGFATALLSAFGLPAPAGGEVGTASAAIQSYGSFIGGGNNPGTSGWPKGWLNILVFDKDYNPIDLAYEQLNSTYVQNVGDPVKRAHGLLSKTVTIKEPGYVYIYVSNEGTVQQEIYFDDMSITHTKGKIVQVDDYYPFGGEFNSYSRENSVKNQYKFNGGSELQDELDLNVYWTELRTYDPWGRLGWWQIDPKVDEFYDQSPYNFSFNNPIRYNDPKGDCPTCDPFFNAGVAVGAFDALKSTVSGALNFFSNASNPAGQVEMAVNTVMTAQSIADNPGAVVDGIVSDVKSTVNTLVNGSSFEQGQIVGGAAVAVADLAVGTKGLTALKATGEAASLLKIEGKLQSAANKASDIVGNGKGAVHGTKVHTEFSKINVKGTSSEVSYKNGQVVPYGTKGSVRADKVAGNVNKPAAVYDLKTGGAKLTPAEIKKYQQNVPGSPPVKEIKPN